MSFGVVFIRVADEEYEHALDWYLATAPQEVERLEAKFADAVERIRQRPLLPKASYANLRITKVDEFPYHIWYRVLDDAKLIEVVAVLHSAQDQTLIDPR